jgi:hypothetical protein
MDTMLAIDLCSGMKVEVSVGTDVWGSRYRRPIRQSHPIIPNEKGTSDRNYSLGFGAHLVRPWNEPKELG